MVSFKTTLFAFAAGTAMAAPVSITKREFSGQCTYYTPSEVGDKSSIGACGDKLADDAPIAAINGVQFDAMRSTICGSYIKVNYEGKSIRAKVADRCSDCAYGNVDVTIPLFEELTGSQFAGRVGLNTDSNKPLTWSFESGEGEGSEDNTPEPPATTTTAAPVATTTTVAPVPTTATPTPTPEPETPQPETPETPENNEVEENIEDDVEKQPIKNIVVNTVVEDKKPETPSNNDSTTTEYDDGMWDPSKTPGDKGFYTPKEYADGTY